MELMFHCSFKQALYNIDAKPGSSWGFVDTQMQVCD